MELIKKSDGTIISSSKKIVVKSRERSLKKLLDSTKSARYLFYQYSGSTPIAELIQYDDTENCTNLNDMFEQCEIINESPLMNTSNTMSMISTFNGCTSLSKVLLMDTKKLAFANNMFYNCTNLQEVNLDLSKIQNATNMFYGCQKLISIIDFKNSKVLSKFRYAFYNCSSIETIKGINGVSIKYSGQNSTNEYDNSFYGCSNLKTLEITNIYNSLNVADCVSLTLESLVGLCKECYNFDNSLTLTIGSSNLEKIANIYVKFTDSSVTSIALREKGEVEVCESTDEGAMSISDYMALKNWTLA